MTPRSKIRPLALSVAVLFFCGTAGADTIVLKNGRRIAALSVVEEGDKVKYLTSAGELSLPKSIVDHVERGGAVPMADSPATAAANLAGGFAGHCRRESRHRPARSATERHHQQRLGRTRRRS